MTVEERGSFPLDKGKGRAITPLIRGLGGFKARGVCGVRFPLPVFTGTCCAGLPPRKRGNDDGRARRLFRSLSRFFRHDVPTLGMWSEKAIDRRGDSRYYMGHGYG